MDMHEVIVGNIGTVYRGNNRAIAVSNFVEYRAQSAGNHGRAIGEPVTYLVNGEIVSEYEPVPVNSD